MTLKGYKWFNDEGKIVMEFRLKDLNIYLYQDTTREEIDKFKAFLSEHDWKVSKVVYNNYSVQG